MLQPRTMGRLLQGVSALVLASLGGWGLAHGRAGDAPSIPPVSERPPMGAPLAERLAVREISVDQRRQAQQLIKAFTLGQMTRHYWGGFAESLIDLGLDAPETLTTQLRQAGDATTLLIQPRLGDESYLAGVARRGGRLATWACVGTGTPADEFQRAVCPKGWQPLQPSEPE